MKAQLLTLLALGGQQLRSLQYADAVGLRRGISLGYDYRHHGMEWTAGECGSRERQSPIDFDKFAPWGEADNAPPGSEFYFDYDHVQDGFGIQSGNGMLSVNVSKRGYGGITFRNFVFNVESVHFRVGSEHTLKGVRLPLEVQIVHSGDDYPGHKLMVSVLFDTAGAGGSPESAAALEGLTQKMPPEGGGSAEVKLVTPADLLAPLLDGGTYFHYTGSLTEPPCTEQVTWLVRQDPLTVTEDELSKLRTAIVSANGGAENWRSPMPLMGRIITGMVAKKGQPQLEVDTAPGERPPMGKLGAEMARFSGETNAKEAFKWAQQAYGIAQGIHRVLASDAQPSAPAPAAAMPPPPPMR